MYHLIVIYKTISNYDIIFTIVLNYINYLFPKKFKFLSFLIF